jgi:hypothetical protein
MPKMVVSFGVLASRRTTCIDSRCLMCVCVCVGRWCVWVCVCLVCVYVCDVRVHATVSAYRMH